jgi:hypothetical protein
MVDVFDFFCWSITSDRLRMLDRFTKLPSTPPGGGW